MTKNKIRKEISEKLNCSCEEVKCKNCLHWGFNNGKPMNCYGDSKCLLRKEKTFALNYCRKIVLK